MITRWKVLLTVLAVISVGAFAVAGWLVYAPSPNPFSAEEILHQGRTKPAGVATYKFTIDARFTVQVEDGPEHQETHAEAVVVVNEGMYVKATENGNYGETLLLNDRQYGRESDAGPWDDSYISPLEWDATNVPNPEADLQLLDGLIQVSREGAEIMGDVRVNKITGKMDMAQHVKEVWGDYVPAGGGGDLRSQMLAGTMAVTAWVGAEDGLLRAYAMEGSFPAVGEAFAYQYSMDVRFSHFNEPLALPSPSAAR